MEELNRNDTTVQTERALLVAVILPGSTNDPRDPLGELRGLGQKGISRRKIWD